jgi:hypothetical protein
MAKARIPAQTRPTSLDTCVVCQSPKGAFTRGDKWCNEEPFQAAKWAVKKFENSLNVFFGNCQKNRNRLRNTL